MHLPAARPRYPRHVALGFLNDLARIIQQVMSQLEAKVNRTRPSGESVLASISATAPL